VARPAFSNWPFRQRYPFDVLAGKTRKSSQSKQKVNTAIDNKNKGRTATMAAATTKTTATTAKRADVKQQNQQKLEFKSWEDLQTRLILVPRVEEEGIGAAVQTFFFVVAEPTSTTESAAGADCTKEPVSNSTAPCSINIEGYELLGFGPVDGEIVSARDDAKPQDTTTTAAAADDHHDWRELDFSEILAKIRGARAPFVLTFVEPTPDLGEYEHDVDSDDDNDSTHTIEFEEKKEDEPSGVAAAVSHDRMELEGETSMEAPDADPPSQRLPSSDSASVAEHLPKPSNPQQPQRQPQPHQQSAATALNLFNDLGTSAFWSSTASRVKASSALATGAALLAQAKERAAMASTGLAAAAANSSNSSSGPSLLSRERSLMDHDDDADDDPDWCYRVGLYLHTSLGAWLSLQSLSKKPSTSGLSALRSSPTSASSSSTASSERVVTNSSMLAVRISETEPVRDATVRYQWYRSDDGLPSRCQEKPKVKLDDGTGTRAPVKAAPPTKETWSLLNGAANAAFQPSACEVGHRLRCVVTFAKSSGPESNNESTATSPESAFNEHQVDGTEEHASEKKTIVLETSEVVRAALPLFNGSRQALVRAAQFSGLEGRGKLEGRSFLVKVGIGMTKKTRRVTSAVTIYQVCGQTAEPMHDEGSPIRGVSAHVPDHSNAKGLELIFARGIPDSAPMVAALATDNRFELQAPNRISRESLLLALGVANYNGQPVNLGDSTILYASPTVEPPAPDDESSSSSSFASCESSEGNCRPSNGNLDDDLFTSAACSPESASLSSRASYNDDMPRTVSTSSLRPPLPTTTQAISHQRSLSLDCVTSSTDNNCSTERESLVRAINGLEEELRRVKDKLDRKNKVVAELQRNVTQTQSSLTSSQLRVSELEAIVDVKDSEQESLAQALRLAEKRISHHDDLVRRMRAEHDAKLAAADETIASQGQRIADLEKAARILQNEKAVQSAALEARDGKLAKMGALQRSFERMSEKVAESESLEDKLKQAEKRYSEKCAELDASNEIQAQCRAELAEANAKLEAERSKQEKERSKVAVQTSELQQLQIKIQKVIAERNNYRQKAESISKEMARICKNGRTLREVEKILAEEASRRQELEVLREQKKKASEELQKYQILYEQARRVQLMAGIDYDTSSVLERNEELERLLAELTEYVGAKEMQLETLKLVNDALQVEIRDLAKAHMKKNDV
jgi:hypothetical protein